MKRIGGTLGVWLVVQVAAAGCSSSSSGPPQIVITSPQSGSVVQLQASDTTTVNFSVSNFALKQPGSCGGGANCGQVYADIDNGACNQSLKMYNAIAPSPTNASTTSVTLDFSVCPASTFSGNHTITLSLRLDNGDQVIGAGNAPAIAQISITTTGGSVTPSQVDSGMP
jgi:hypothetical protein